MAIKTITQVLCAVAALFLTSTAFAQIPVPYGPRDPISFTVTFEGPSTDDINGIQILLNLNSPPHDDQKVLSRSIVVGDIEKIGPGKFKVSGNIPDYAASGTYTLQRIAAGPRTLGLVFEYSSGLPSLTITVENPKHFTQPTLKGVEIDPRH